MPPPETGLASADGDEPRVRSAPPAGAKVMRLRYSGICATCGAALAESQMAEWNPSTRKLRCVPCQREQTGEEGPCVIGDQPAGSPHDEASLDTGEAGASARREFQRRHNKRQQQIAARWGRLTPVVNFLTDDPQSTQAWARGSDGERRLGAHLERVLGESAVLLHDRKVPRTRGNLDHVAVAASGVWVIDAKNYRGTVERRDVGGWFRIDHRLFVGGRDRTRLVVGMDRQVDAVKSVLSDRVSVHAALCFTAATWRLFAKPFRIGTVWVTWANALAALITAPGELEGDEVTHVASQLSRALRPASPARNTPTDA